MIGNIDQLENAIKTSDYNLYDITHRKVQMYDVITLSHSNYLYLIIVVKVSDKNIRGIYLNDQGYISKTRDFYNTALFNLENTQFFIVTEQVKSNPELFEKYNKLLDEYNSLTTQHKQKPVTRYLTLLKLIDNDAMQNVLELSSWYNFPKAERGWFTTTQKPEDGWYYNPYEKYPIPTKDNIKFMYKIEFVKFTYSHTNESINNAYKKLCKKYDSTYFILTKNGFKRLTEIDKNTKLEICADRTASVFKYSYEEIPTYYVFHEYGHYYESYYHGYYGEKDKHYLSIVPTVINHKPRPDIVKMLSKIDDCFNNEYPF
jgi:hypothetical protein